MKPLPGRLGTLTARDIMTERLVVLRDGDTIQHAANLFRDLHISGAPVVNDAGVPVGLLSISDIVPAVAARMTSLARPEPGGAPSRESEWAEICDLLNAGSTQAEAGAAEPVGKWMSRRLVSVREDTMLVDVARVMCDGHWHRVTVTDAQGRLRGIVSTMDVLAALVQAADEARRE
jgi:predicted transcriptional regulator